MAKSDSSEVGLVVAGAILGCIVLAVVGALGFAYSVLAGGYVVSVLWCWFITPVFGVAAPGVLACAGLVSFTSYISGGTVRAIMANNSSDEKAMSGAKIIAVLLTPWLTLFFGWVIHSFM